MVEEFKFQIEGRLKPPPSMKYSFLTVAVRTYCYQLYEQDTHR